MQLKILTWQKILIDLLEENKIITKIALNIGTTNAACYKNIKLLEKEKLVTTKKTGRIKTISITAKGRGIAQALTSLTDSPPRKKREVILL